MIAVQTVTTPEGKTSTVKRTDTRVAVRPARPVLDDVPAHAVHRDRWRDAHLGVQRRHRDRDAAPKGARRTTELDVYGRVTKQTLDRPLAALEYTYDELGRPKTMKQGAESVTFAYDAKHRLATETDAGNNVDRLRLRRRGPRDARSACRVGARTATPRTTTATSRR